MYNELVYLYTVHPLRQGHFVNEIEFKIAHILYLRQYRRDFFYAQRKVVFLHILYYFVVCISHAHKPTDLRCQGKRCAVFLYSDKTGSQFHRRFCRRTLEY